MYIFEKKLSLHFHLMKYTKVLKTEVNYVSFGIFFRVQYPRGGGRTSWSKTVGWPQSPRTSGQWCCRPCLAWQRWARYSVPRPLAVWAPGHVWWPVTWCPLCLSLCTCIPRYRYWFPAISWWAPGWDVGRRPGRRCSWRSRRKWRTSCPTGKSANSRETVAGRRWLGTWPEDSRWDVGFGIRKWPFTTFNLKSIKIQNMNRQSKQRTSK